MPLDYINLRNKAFTPRIIKEIVEKLSDRAAVRLCQASKSGCFYANLCRKQAIEQYSQALKCEKELLSTDYFYFKFYTIKEAVKHAEMERKCLENIREAFKDDVDPEMIKEIEEEIHWAEKHASSAFILKSENFVGHFSPNE